LGINCGVRGKATEAVVTPLNVHGGEFDSNMECGSDRKEEVLGYQKAELGNNGI
jgi:hypothetical protein